MKLTNYVAEFISQGKIFSRIFKEQQKQLDKIDTDIQDLINQCFIQTATWSLNIWEEQYKLEVDLTDTYENRRARVLSTMRGVGTCTKALIEEVCTSFANGSCEVIENNDYSFTIKFTGVYGIPPNMADVRKIIDTIKPAHLGYNFIYKYLVWDNLDKYNISYNSLDYFTWEDLEVDNIHVLEMATEIGDNMADELNNIIVSERIE